MLGLGGNPLKAMQTGIPSSGYEKYCTSCLLALKVSRVMFGNMTTTWPLELTLPNMHLSVLIPVELLL